MKLKKCTDDWTALYKETILLTRDTPLLFKLFAQITLFLYLVKVQFVNIQF